MTDDDVVEGEAQEIPEGEGVHLPVVAPPAQSTALVARDDITVSELVAQSAVIEDAMRHAMKDGVHYGRIPGVNKPTLLKPGAEKLLVLFRLAPSYDSEKIWHEDGHLTVMTKCTLTHIPTGLVIAEGEGMCTTKESRYAWRKGERTCPECGKATVREGKPRNGRPGNWYCWNKSGVSDGCGSTWDLDSEQGSLFKAMETGRVPNPDLPDSFNCVTPDTRILTHELRWVRAGDIETGEILIGVDEEMDTRYARRLALGEATVYGTREDMVYEITLEDGRSVRCNGEHMWLVKKIGLGGTEWVSTQEIHRETAERRRGRPRNWTVMSLCSPWEEDKSRETGYIAGLFDADGSLGVSRSNQVLVLFGAGKPVRIKAISEVGMEEIVLLGTSCSTYIAEGLVCHNTVMKMSGKRSLTSAILNGTAASDIFTQDLEGSMVREDKSGTNSESTTMREPGPFNPATQLRDDAPDKRSGWQGISDLFNEIDPSLEWGVIIRQAISSIYGGDGDFRKLEGPAKSEAAYRTANAAGRLSELFISETFLSNESIQKAFAEMFDGIVVCVPEYSGDLAVDPETDLLDGDR